MLNSKVLFHFTLLPTIRSTAALGWQLVGLVDTNWKSILMVLQCRCDRLPAVNEVINDLQSMPFLIL